MEKTEHQRRLEAARRDMMVSLYPKIKGARDFVQSVRRWKGQAEAIVSAEERNNV